MTDIYDIKSILLGFPINIIYSLIFIILLIILYIIYYMIINKKVEKIKEKPIKIKEEKDFNLILLDFEKNNLSLASDRFYSALIEILRDILEYKWNKNISKMTFEEINNLKLDDSLKNMIKSIYYKEYTKKIDDNDKIRLTFIKNIKKLIK